MDKRDLERTILFQSGVLLDFEIWLRRMRIKLEEYFAEPPDRCERLISGLEYCLEVDEVEIDENEILYAVENFKNFPIPHFLFHRFLKKDYSIVECSKIS
jgi:hypothetical protein